MIKRIRIGNYRSLRDVELEPSPLLNAFVGPNASGKSGFVDALRFLTNVAVGGVSRALTDRGGYPEVFWKGEAEEREISFDLSVELPLNLNEPPVPAHYLLVIEGSPTGLITVKRELLRIKHESDFVSVIDMMAGHGKARHVDGSMAFDPPGNPAISLLEFNIPNWAGSFFKEYLSLAHFYDLIPTAMRQLKPFTKAQYLSPYGDNLVEFLTTLKTAHSDAFRRIEQVVQDSFPDLEHLISEPNQAGQVFLAAKEKFLKRPVNVWNMAQGELAFIALAALILSPPEFGAPITCVEEPENHLHPRLLEVLIELLRQTEARLIADGQGAAQIFVTTHSPYLVDRLHLDELIVVEKVRGETRFSRPKDKAELRELLSREQQGLGELWFSGALGGV